MGNSASFPSDIIDFYNVACSEVLALLDVM